MEYSVSILIPTYNRANLIERAINSSLKQTYKCEIIVCDHGSNDNTYEICKSYGDKIKYIRREVDYGLHFCEIEALLAAKSKLIHFCFDDDWMHPEYIEKSVGLFNENIGMVYSDYELIDLDEEFINKKKWNIFDNKIEKINIFSGSPIVLKGLISPSCALVRKSDAVSCMYLTNNLLSNNSYSGVGPDWLITALPIFKYKNCIHIREQLVRFGVHNESITIDAQRDFSSEKAKSFRAAYAGARLYLIISVIIRKLKIESIYFFIEEAFRKTKSTLKRIVN
jgi:glycosyltransferase involved in cell wall biosynthesis